MNAYKESPNLDFLRSLAVLFVTAFHILLLSERRHDAAVSQFRFFHSIGNWGVLIFFVHTSLVLMFSLERQHGLFGNSPSYLPFLTRRIFRVYPLSIFIVLCVVLLKLPVADITSFGFQGVHLKWEGVIANLLLYQNLTHTSSVIAPLWSLPYEMQMYLFLPGLFLLVWNTRRAWPILGLWAVAVVLAMHGGGLERHGVPDFIIYVPYFLSGVFAYELSKGWTFQLPVYTGPLVLAAVTALYLSAPNLMNSWLCCMLLATLVPQFKELQNPALRRVFHLIARYSYGIYLTHFICIWLAFQELTAPEWLRWVTFLATATIFPVLVYHALERPMMKMGERAATTVRERLQHATPATAHTIA
jgi:peptidoglycan/LPS O-acetylase OafA/YrhL